MSTKIFFMKRGDDSLLHLLCNHAYYAQVQGEMGQMAMLDVELCDCVVFSNDTVVVDRIIADYDYWTNFLEKLEQFYLQHVVPELLSGNRNLRQSVNTVYIMIIHPMDYQNSLNTYTDN